MKNKHRSELIVMLSLALITGVSHAGELRVNAPVVNVEPVLAPPTQIEECPAKPSHSAGLIATLQWDLAVHCRLRTVASDTISGYRVFYEWDNRTYSRIMSTEPSGTIVLNVSID